MSTTNIKRDSADNTFTLSCSNQEKDSETLTAPKTEIARIKNALWKIQTARRISLLICFVLFNATVLGVGPWPILLPVYHTLGTPVKTIGDAFAALQNLLFQAIFPWIPLAAFLLTGIIIGRALCGWACPFGFVQELLGYIKRKQTELSPRTHQDMIKVKYAILGITLFLSTTLAASLAAGTGQGYRDALGLFAPAPFNALSPADTLFAIIPKIVFDATYSSFDTLADTIVSAHPILWIRLAVMSLVLIFSVYIPRGWCRYLCPHGALLALIGKFSFLGLKRDPVKCTKAGCRTCVEACPMDVPILDLPWKKFTDTECIYCLQCVDACETKAIRPKFP
jgi:polyferredoxin